MTLFIKRIIIFLSLPLIFNLSSFASTSEILGEIVGFSMGKGIKRADLTLPIPHLVHADIETETKRQIREFIDEKINEIPAHDFFSIDRFAGAVPALQDEILIENWSVWYFGKYMVGELGGINAKKELDKTLASKREFYENIDCMTTDPQVGLQAKEFYRRQLDCVNQLTEEDVE